MSAVRRAILLVAAVGMTTGAGLATAGFALAANGAQPGNLILHPGSGAASLQPTWSTTDGCPTGYRGSAEVSEFKPNGTFASRISTVVNSGLTAGFSGTLDGKMRSLLRVTGVTNGGTVEFAVGCYTLEGGTGNVQYVQSTMVTLSANGKSYSTSSSASASPTTTPSVSATPTPTSTATPTPTASSLPAGGAQTGAGGASLPGSGNDLLIALGATLLAGSAAAAGLAVRHAKWLPGKARPGGTKPTGR